MLSHPSTPGPSGELEPEEFSEELESEEEFGVPDEDWKHDEGFDEAQQLSGSAQPVLHQ